MAARKPQTPEEKAYRVALSRLNRAAMSRARLAAKLAAAGFDDATCAAVLDRLASAGLLDDEAYARALIDEFAAAGDAAPRLRQKLLQRGVDETLADRLLRSHSDPRDNLAQARAFAASRLRGMARLDAVARARRLAGALARRGYDADIVETIVAELVGSAMDPSAD